MFRGSGGVACGATGILDRRLTRNIGVGVHDVVRIEEAADHEERLAGPARCGDILAQPAHALAGDEGIVVIAALRRTADVAGGAEDVESIGLGGRAIVDRRLHLEKVLVHLELAEKGGLVAESLQHRSHIGQIRRKTRHEGIFHLVDDAVDLRRLAGEQRRTRRRAHGRRDVVVLEGDAVARDRVHGRQRVVGPRQQPVRPLVDDDEHDVVGRRAGGARGRAAFLGLRGSTPEGQHEGQQQAEACQPSQAEIQRVAEMPACHVVPSPRRSAALEARLRRCGVIAIVPQVALEVEAIADPLHTCVALCNWRRTA